MRTKEEANDYRYFPCPDLLPVTIDKATIETLSANMPELPDARQARFANSYQLSDYDAGILSAERAMAEYFEATTKVAGDAKLAANWIMGELSALLNSEEKTIEQSPVSGDQLGGLIARIKDNTISNKIAKTVFEALWNGEGDSADAVIEAKGLKQVSDTGALEKIVDEVIANKPQEVENFLKADEKKRKKMMGAFMGPIMQATKGQANPGLVNKILAEKLNALL